MGGGGRCRLGVRGGGGHGQRRALMMVMKVVMRDSECGGQRKRWVM